MKQGLNQTAWLALAALAALALAGIGWWLLASPEPGGHRRAALPVSSQNITGFDIRSSGPASGAGMVALRIDSQGVWNLTAPIKDRADPDTVAKLIDAIGGIEAEQAISGVTDFRIYGLDQPQLTITVHQKNAKPVTLQVGAESPIPEMVYARVGEKPEVLVIPGGFKMNFSGEVGYLRDKRVISVTGEQLRELTFQIGRGQTYRAVQAGGIWRLAEPYREVIAPEQAAALINGLNGLYAHEFIDDPEREPEYGLDAPDYQLGMKLVDGREIALAAKKKGNDYYMRDSRRPALIRQINPEAFHFLNPAAPVRMNPKLVVYGKDQIKSIAFRMPGLTERTFRGRSLAELWEAVDRLVLPGAYYGGGPAQGAIEIDRFTGQWVAGLTLELKQPGPEKLTLSIYRHPDRPSDYLIATSERSYLLEAHTGEIDRLIQKGWSLAGKRD
jgi:hypothetical protein